MINGLYDVFSLLKDVKKFQSVFIDEVGNVAWNIDENTDNSIHWKNRIDLCKDMLYLESVPYIQEKDRCNSLSFSLPKIPF